MIRAASLGIRLAVRAKPSRSSLIIVGAALATMLLLTMVGTYEAIGTSIGRPATGDAQRFFATVGIAVGAPIVVLLITSARLSSGTRERRAAALSRLGVARRRIRTLAGAENAVLALVGGLVGVALHVVAAAPLLERLGRDPGWFDRAPVASGLAMVGLPIGVVIAAAGVAYLPNRAARPGSRVDVTAARPRAWRLIPLTLGAAGLVVATTLHGTTDRNPTAVELAGFLGGTALAVLGLPIALPVAVRLLGDVVTRSRVPSVAIAGRGLQTEPTATTRLVAAVLAALTVVTGGFCVLQSFWDLPQVRRPVIADTVGPQFGSIWLQPGEAAPSDAQLDQLAAVPGVRAVVPMPDSLVENEPGACDRFDDPAAFCSTPFVGTCDDLVAFQGAADGCRDDAVLLIATQQWAGDTRWSDAQRAWLRPNGYAGPTPPDPLETAVEIPVPSGQVVVPFYPEDPLRDLQDSIFVPTALVTDLPVGQVRLVMDGGPAVRAAVETMISALPGEYFAEDLSELRKVESYDATTWAVAVVMLATGLAGLAIAGADRSIERRRRIASLWAVGAPPKVLRRSQLLQSLLPLVVGAPLAIAIGGLIGSAYLSLGGIVGRFPWSQTFALLAIALGAAVVAALVSQLGLGRRPTPDLLRRE